MRKFFGLAALVCMLSTADLYALTDYESQQYAAINQSYFSNLMRFCMQQFKDPGYIFLDHSLSLSPTVTASCIIEGPLLENDGSAFSVLFGFQTYLFSSDVIGFNLIGGASANLPELRTKIYTGAYWGIGEDYVTDEYLARNKTDTWGLVWKQVHPFFYIVNPWTEKLKTRGDITFTGSELTKWGLGALLEFMGFRTETTYDRVLVFRGTESNASLIGWMISQQEETSMTAYVPHIMLRFGQISHNIDGGSYSYLNGIGERVADSSWKNNYFIGEWKPDIDGLREFQGGISYSQRSGAGFMVGVGGGEKGFMGYFNIMHNYLQIDIFGSRTENWAYAFQMVRTDLF